MLRLLFLFAAALMTGTWCNAAEKDLFIGTWKLSPGKSLQEGAVPSIPMNLITDYSLDQSGNLQVKVTAFGNNQIVHTETIQNYALCDGAETAVNLRVRPFNIWPDVARFRSPTFAVACTKIGPEDRALDVIVRSEGRLVSSSQRLISHSDGSLIEVKTGITPSGEYYRSLLVWERKD
jgi:hypothetical protein